MSYLVQSSSGVAEEGDAVSIPNTDRDRSEAGSRGVPRRPGLQGRPACHGTGGVVGAAGIRLESILQHRFYLNWRHQDYYYFI